MPFVTLYLKKGSSDDSLKKCMYEITKAGANTLENTLERMIRVTIIESDECRTYNGGKITQQLQPSVIFRIGPGRSPEAKLSFMNQIADILSSNLNCCKDDVRGYILDNVEGHHFCIGGKHKDFSKKVK